MPFYVLIILLTFFPLTASFSDVLQEKVSRDILTVQVGGSVTIGCEDHIKYGGSLKWGLLTHSKTLPTNSLIKNAAKADI